MPTKKPKKTSRKPKVSQNAALLKKIQACVDEKIKPLIEMHGGYIEIAELTKDNVLRVRLAGVCQGCAAAPYTLQYGVQNILNEEFPDEDILVEPVEEVF